MYSRFFVFQKNEIQFSINNLQSTEVQYMDPSIAALLDNLKLPAFLQWIELYIKDDLNREILYLDFWE